MTTFLRRYFSFNTWRPCGDFVLIRADFDWLRNPMFGYFSIALGLFGLCARITFHPHGDA